MCDKAVSTYPLTITFIPECCTTQEMCDKAVNNFFLYLILFLTNIKIKKCDNVVSKDPFSIVYCPDKYKTQRTCDETVDNSLSALKLVSDWFVTSKQIKKVFTAFYADENILYFNENSGNVVFFF